MATKPSKEKLDKDNSISPKAHLSANLTDTGISVGGSGSVKDNLKLLEALIISFAEQISVSPDKLLAYLSDAITNRQADKIADLVDEFLDKLRRL